MPVPIWVGWVFTASALGPVPTSAQVPQLILTLLVDIPPLEGMEKAEGWEIQHCT